jgi:hypothetical protein
VPPNNYPFYNDDEKYVPIMQADGGQLSGKNKSFTALKGFSQTLYSSLP